MANRIGLSNICYSICPMNSGITDIGSAALHSNRPSSEGVDIASILGIQNLLSLIVIIAELMEVIGS